MKRTYVGGPGAGAVGSAVGEIVLDGPVIRYRHQGRTYSFRGRSATIVRLVVVFAHAGDLARATIAETLKARYQVPVAVAAGRYQNEAFTLGVAGVSPEVAWAVRATTSSFDSPLHGPAHWYRVGENAAALAAVTPGADAEVAGLFALFHDAMRNNDGCDPLHGSRAAALAFSMRDRLELSDDRLGLLVDACAQHTDGRVSDDPTVGCCWDADRLDLGRVGIRPNAALFSTRAGKRRAEMAAVTGT